MKAALIALLLAAPNEPTLLRRALAVGAETYKIEDKVQQTVDSPLGSQPMAIATSRTLVLKTASVDAASGTGRVEATTTVDKVDASGGAASLMGAKPQPTVQTGKLDVRGRLAFDPLPRTDALANLLSGTGGTVTAGVFVELPEKPVRIGDSWDVVVPKSPYLLDADQRLAAVLTGERDFEGKPVWTVSIRGTIRTDVDTSRLPGGKGVETAMGTLTLRMRGAVEIAGEGLVEKATGRTLSMETKGTSKATIDLVEPGITLQTVGTVESKAKLQP